MGIALTPVARVEAMIIVRAPACETRALGRPPSFFCLNTVLVVAPPVSPRLGVTVLGVRRMGHGEGGGRPPLALELGV